MHPLPFSLCPEHICFSPESPASTARLLPHPLAKAFAKILEFNNETGLQLKHLSGSFPSLSQSVMLAHGTVGGDLPGKSMCWKTLLNITAISCSQASNEARRSLCQGAPASAPSQGRHRAGLHARLQPCTNEVLLATAWRVLCPAEEEWESWGL